MGNAWAKCSNIAFEPVWDNGPFHTHLRHRVSEPKDLPATMAIVVFYLMKQGWLADPSVALLLQDDISHGLVCISSPQGLPA